jgi:hypothetical protein
LAHYIEVISMATTIKSPGVTGGVLVTVAFLKAQLDTGNDHLGIFVPLVLDVIVRLPLSEFTVEDIQLALSTTHHVSMPKHVVGTLLRRVGKKYLKLQNGSYKLIPGIEIPKSSVDAKKQQIEQGQMRLAEELRLHAKRRKLVIVSAEAALDLLYKFLESEQVALLLDTPTCDEPVPKIGQRERSVVAEFIQNIVQADPALLNVLRAMLEGLVLYHAAFLPDLCSAKKRFRNLRVVFDSSLVREALGYWGPVLKSLSKEAIDVLKASGIECVVFDETLDEIRRILAMYEAHLGTTKGRAELKPGPMTRYFLTQRFTQSDVVEMTALLERDVAAAGFRILARPPRQAKFTAGEKDLAARLKRPNTGPEIDMEPRVIHDVECIAGVLTLRRGNRSNRLEDAGVVFATDSATVIRTVQDWWREDEGETAVAPIVHIRVLANLAWLKKPALCGDFKIQELVALCASALRPEPATWGRFLKHLLKLQEGHRVTSDEVAAILVSEMLDRTLKAAEFETDDAEEIGAATFDEAVERVMASYAAEAERKIHETESERSAAIADAEQRAQSALERADSAERDAAERARKRDLRIRARAGRWARLLAECARWVANAVLIIGAFSLISGHDFHPGIWGIVTAGGIVVFVILEFVAIRGEVSEWLSKLEGWLNEKLLTFFGIDD